jgi:hypothetical protein
MALPVSIETTCINFCCPKIGQNVNFPAENPERLADVYRSDWLFTGACARVASQARAQYFVVSADEAKAAFKSKSYKSKTNNGLLRLAGRTGKLCLRKSRIKQDKTTERLYACSECRTTISVFAHRSYWEACQEERSPMREMYANLYSTWTSLESPASLRMAMSTESKMKWKEALKEGDEGDDGGSSSIATDESMLVVDESEAQHQSLASSSQSIPSHSSESIPSHSSGSRRGQVRESGRRANSASSFIAGYASSPPIMSGSEMLHAMHPPFTPNTPIDSSIDSSSIRGSSSRSTSAFGGVGGSSPLRALHHLQQERLVSHAMRFCYLSSSMRHH